MTPLHQCLGDRYELEALEYFGPEAQVCDVSISLSDEEMEGWRATCDLYWSDYDSYLYLSDYYSALADIYDSGSSMQR